MTVVHNKIQGNEKVVKPVLKEYRCINCGKKICMAKIEQGVVEIKCRCSVINTIGQNKSLASK
ncbi:MULTISPECIES: hypothetical protein [unclassified Paraflavitalea]|uniref:hypothetical protein n=1 Tax=unclassified Paraflavitalea TaxID=2798305 RepID=UPI003D3278E0